MSSGKLAKSPPTRVEQNIDVGNWRIGGRETMVAPGVPWSVRRQRLHGGKQDGVDLLVIDNGRMTITLVPTRGMGILHVVSGALRLGWDSPVREGWLEGFNEWMTRCGLEWGGPSGTGSFRQQRGRAGGNEPHAAREGGEHPGVRSGSHRGARATARIQVRFRVEVAELPYVTLWKNLAAREEGYVTGLEPGTSFPYTRRLEREAGRVPKLQPGGTRHFAIDIALHTTTAAVRAVDNRIHRIQNGRPTQIGRAPER